MKLLSVALLTAFALNGCAKKSADAQMAPPAPPAERVTAAAGSAPKAVDQVGPASAKHVDTRKVIRTGRIDLAVEAIDPARDKLDAIVQGAGGYIDSTQVEKHGSTNTAVIVIRMPAEAFSTMVPVLQQIGEITAETTNAADITDQFVDTEAQLASAQQLEKRLLEIATAKNGTLEQILAVEHELARVRAEIDGYQGHLKQWNDQVSLSTLTITITQKLAAVAIAPPPPPAKTLGSKTSDSFHSSIDALRDVASWMLIHGVALLPWLLFLVPAGFGLQRFMRRHRRIPVAVATIAPTES